MMACEYCNRYGKDGITRILTQYERMRAYERCLGWITQAIMVPAKYCPVCGANLGGDAS